MGQLYDRLDDITGDIQQLVVTKMSELGGDAQLLQLLRDTAATSVESFFSSIRHGIPVSNLEPPSATLEYARRLAQRDISVNALTRAYRLGHRATLRMVIKEIRAANLDPALSLAVYDLMEDVSFEYIDQITQQVVASYQDERDRWIANRNNIRVVQVRELLTAGAVDVDAMTTALRYPLRRHHLAVVVWYPDTVEQADPSSMERFVQKLGETAGAATHSLFVPIDRVTGWGWIPLAANAAPSALARLRAFVEKTTDGPLVTAGNPLPDADGFRRSHQQARDAWAVVSAAGTATRRITAADDAGLAVAALMGGNVDAAAAYVSEVLGPLATDSDGDERLRETLRVFLSTGSSYTASAEELHLHHNSVKNRVQRAVERRGRPIAGDRLEVEVALLLCEWLGAAVLR